MLGREFLLKRIKKLKSKNNQRGFTLLELLVVVAILAAIAGTATVALQDTDARAAAAAHVAMMDELNKGVNTFRVLQHNVYPNNFDSLAYVTSSGDASTAALLPNGDGDILGLEDNVEVGAIISGVSAVMSDIGMTELRYINAAATESAGTAPADTGDNGTVDTAQGPCEPTSGNLQASVASRSNAMVPGNIFNGPEGNGCGESITLSDTAEIAYWTGSVERILGPGDYGDAAYDVSTNAVTATTPSADAVAPILMAVGFGPSSSLFNTGNLGAMTSVPVYRHVNADQYNRFIGLFKVAESTYDGSAWSTPSAVDQVLFVGVVDGAGDTKEEELGEWDGTRNTI